MNLENEILTCHTKNERSDRKDLITSWDEREIYKGEVRDVFSVIFRTRGCSWAYLGGCSMCGYYTDTNPDIKDEDLEKQISEALERYDDQPIVKIYTSGSFFDEREVSNSITEKILDSFDTEKTLIESRPEFITKKKLKNFSELTNKLEVAIGLESANDFVLKRCINKGFTFEGYKRAAERVKENDALLRTYLLLKPPFLTESEAIQDTLESIDKVTDLSDIISINPVNVQRGSLIEHLWYKNVYRPPWLWSLVEVLKKSRLDTKLVSSKAGLGSDRGTHNCGECDDEIIDKIDQFNISQDKSILDEIKYTCSCRDEWELSKEIGDYLFFRGDPGILSNRYAGYI
ncbi:MAG: archaeosine biosynthesis radical SAM protein RaSEA [Thermoplasmatota archaeon]